LNLSAQDVANFSGAEHAKGTVGPFIVVLGTPVLREDLSLQDRAELAAVQQLDPEPSVEALPQAFCHGRLGSMKALPTPLNRHQSADA
jgi:hypothetical protein